MKDFFKKIVVTILTFEAKILLRRTHPIIIAVTGSVGKTSIKDVIFEVFKSKMHVRKSEKSFNVPQQCVNKTKRTLLEQILRNKY